MTPRTLRTYDTIISGKKKKIGQQFKHSKAK